MARRWRIGSGQLHQGPAYHLGKLVTRSKAKRADYILFWCFAAT